MTLQYFAVIFIMFTSLLFLLIIQLFFISRKPKVWYKEGVTIEAKALKDPETLRFIYEKAQEMLIHYDNLNWQIGSILLGSNLVTMGLSLQQRIGSLSVPILAVAGIISQFAWAFWFTRHVAMYNLRNDVLYRIEMELGIPHHSLPANQKVKNGRWLGLISGKWTAVFLSIGLSFTWLLIAWIA